MRRLPHLFLLIFVSLQVSAQSLWQESEFGMTPAQVQQLFPKAHPPSSPDMIYGGATELLYIPAIEIAGYQFRSSFFFKENKLTQVILTLTEVENTRDAKLAFDSLSDELRKKYGAEKSKEVSEGFMTSFHSTWISGKTKIKLYYNSIENAEPILNLIYQV